MEIFENDEGANPFYLIETIDAIVNYDERDSTLGIGLTPRQKMVRIQNAIKDYRKARAEYHEGIRRKFL